jgi:hypothetical protein
MRYAGSMTPGPSLNTALAHTWAAVVSGTAWKRHTLEDGGTLTAEYMRGPLIVWATRPGESVQADGPAVSPLEDRIDRLNTAQVFERFKWAARGKVRPSVRWKTGRRPRRAQKLEGLANLLHDVMHAKFWEPDPPKCLSYTGLWTPKGVIRRRQAVKARRLSDRLRDLAPAHDEGSFNGIDSDVIEWLNFYDLGFREARMRPGLRFTELAVPKSRFAQPVIPDSRMAAYFALTGRRESLGVLLNHWKFRRPTLGEILAAFQRAEYRAHLTRRVKPAPRRHRVRRPLYARPRPPSAPLAPPVI